MTTAMAWETTTVARIEIVGYQPIDLPVSVPLLHACHLLRGVGLDIDEPWADYAVIGGAAQPNGGVSEGTLRVVDSDDDDGDEIRAALRTLTVCVGTRR